MAKQENLPGVETFKIPALQKAAIEYAEARDERQELQRDREVPLKQKVIALMRKHELEEYVGNGLKITLTPGEDKLKVKLADEDD